MPFRITGRSQAPERLYSMSNTLQACPVTGSKVNALPPDHPDTSNSDKPCPVTNATVQHHEGIVRPHPSVSSTASADDCPVLRKAEESNVCPVVGTTATVLPPNHPPAMNGEVCPVTGAKAEHHDSIGQHPSVQQADGSAKCPVTGAVAEHHKTVDANAANTAMAQCPVTGQFADGSRPEVALLAEILAEPIQYTLIGIPFSTFTRTIAMGLHELKIPFSQEAVAPHSEEVLKYNPFGRLPVLKMEHSGKVMTMFESESIARYLDSSDERMLRFGAKDMVNNQILEEWTSIISNYVFPAVEKGVVKPYLADKSADLSEGLEEMHKILAIIESRMASPYLMGFRTTWGDLFLYPILADLAATPYTSELNRYQKLNAWVDRMHKRSTAKLTLQGTLGAGASPP